MKFIDFLGRLFSGGTKKVNLTDAVDETDVAEMQLTAFAASVAVDLIAGVVSKCDFKTVMRNKDDRGHEWYLWNVSPNDFQSGAEFKQLLVEKLLTKNEVLVVSSMEKLYIAECYDIDQKYLMYGGTYKNVEVLTESGDLLKFDKNFQESDVIHIRLRDTNITALLKSIDQTYNKLLALSINKYRRSDGRKGILQLDKPVAGDRDAQEKQQNALQAGFKKYYNDENGLVILNRGMQYTENQTTSGKNVSEVSNFAALSRECFIRAAQAFRIPPALLLGEVADTSTAMDQMLTTCIDPLITLIASEINKKRYGDEILNGSHMTIDTTNARHIDAASISSSIDKVLADGILSIDEIRRIIGYEPLNTDFSNTHWMTKNYDTAENIMNSGGAS